LDTTPVAYPQVTVPPRNDSSNSKQQKNLSQEETEVLDLLLKACLKKVNNNQQTIQQTASQHTKKIRPDDKMAVYEAYIKERIEKELNTPSVDKFDNSLEPNNSAAPFTILPTTVLEQLLENVTSDVKRDSSLQAASNMQIHNTLRSVVRTQIPTISQIAVAL
jgi:flagellar hook-basal body complex protein FliE